MSPRVAIGPDFETRKDSGMNTRIWMTLAFASCLASRAVAGDVTAAVTNGTLNITGSSGDDVVVIDQEMLPAGHLNVSPGVGTTINGGSNPIEFTVTKDVVVRLGAGEIGRASCRERV